MRARESELRSEPGVVAEAGNCLAGCELLRQRLGAPVSASHEQDVVRALGVEPARARQQAVRLRVLLPDNETAGVESVERMRIEVKLLRYLAEHQDSAGECSIGLDDLLAIIRS